MYKIEKHNCCLTVFRKSYTVWYIWWIAINLPKFFTNKDETYNNAICAMKVWVRQVSNICMDQSVGLWMIIYVTQVPAIHVASIIVTGLGDHVLVHGHFFPLIALTDITNQVLGI